MSFIALTRPSPREVRLDRLKDGSPVDSLIFRAMTGREIKSFFKEQQSLTRTELRPMILVKGAQRLEGLQDSKKYVLETYYNFVYEGLDRYRVEDKIIEDIVKELREKERIFAMEGRNVVALDDFL